MENQPKAATKQSLLWRLMVWTILDSSIILLCYSFAYAIRLGASTKEFIAGGWFIALAITTNLFFFYLNGIHRRLWKQSGGTEVQVILLATVQATTFAGVLLFVLGHPLPLGVVLGGQLVSLPFFIGMRYRSRLWRGMRWRYNFLVFQEMPQVTQSAPPKRVLVVGAGESGGLFVSHTNKLKKGESTIIGYVDDDPAKMGLLIEGKAVLGTIGDVPTIVEKYKIERIVIAIHRLSGARFRQIMDLCLQTQVEVKVMPDVLGVIHRENSVEERDIRIEDLIGRPIVPDTGQIDLAQIQHRRILITGAAGSVGSELSRQLARQDICELLLLDNNESGLYDIVNELQREHHERPLSIKAILCDVTDSLALEHVFKTYCPQVLYHAAAYKHVPLLEAHPAEAVRVNLGGTLNTTRLAQRYGVERFVLISTDKAVHSTNVMGATKFLCEQTVRAFYLAYPEAKTLVSVVRFGNVLGSRGSVVPLFKQQIMAGGPVTVTDARMTRYFMSIPEAAFLVIQASCMTRGGDLFVLEMGERMRILELAERMIQLHNLRPYSDIPIEFIGKRPGETLHESLIIPGEERHPTAHPYISSYKLPFIDANKVLDGTQKVVDELLIASTGELKRAVFQLVESIQVYYQHQPTS